MKEPLSTLSNSFYGVASLLIAQDLFGEIVHPGAFYVALSAFLLMLGSGAYHWTLKPTHQAWDEMAMYFVVASFVGLIIEMHSYFHFGLFVWAVLCLFAVSYWERMDSFKWIPGSVIALCIAIGIIAGAFEGSMLFILFAASAAIRQIGHKLGGFMEDVLHSLWHLGTASGIYLAYTSLIA